MEHLEYQSFIGQAYQGRDELVFKLEAIFQQMQKLNDESLEGQYEKNEGQYEKNEGKYESHDLDIDRELEFQ